jgi:hypothetical protein
MQTACAYNSWLHHTQYIIFCLFCFSFWRSIFEHYVVFIVICYLWSWCQFEECSFLGCGTAWVCYEPTFQRNVSPPSLGWNSDLWLTVLSIPPNCSQCNTFAHSCYSSTLNMRRHVSPKHQYIINPHGATFQKMAFFIVTAVKTLNPTWCQFVCCLLP